MNLIDETSCCETVKRDKISCGFLKLEKSIIIALDACTLILNLADLKWISFRLPLGDGVLFNGDAEEEVVYYIAPVNDSMSALYSVSPI